MAGCLASTGYAGRTDPTVLHARLTAAPRGATAEHGITLAHITRALLTVLATLARQIEVSSSRISTLCSRLRFQIGPHAPSYLPRQSNASRAKGKRTHMGR
jgi:transposase